VVALHYFLCRINTTPAVKELTKVSLREALEKDFKKV